jgi:IS30 family transposase
MKTNYTQLEQKERDQIFLLLQEGKTQKEIASIIGRDKSTISRELSRNLHQKFYVYLPDTAQRKTEKRKVQSRKQQYLDRDLELKQYVLTKLKTGWSPEQIEGRIEIDLDKYLNYESIYQYIYSLAGRKENLRQYLRRAHRIRRKKNGRKHHKGKIPNRIDISLRPKDIETRSEFGHWEGDSLIYKRHTQSLATYTERKTRFIVAKKAKDRTAQERVRLTNCYYVQLPPEARRTVTYDNGLEFSAHEEISSTLGIDIYFARPYASWQRGSNENSNGLIRWYLPKDIDLDFLTDEELDAIIKLINDRPRKCLNWKTSSEAFNEEMNKIIKQKSNNLLTSHSVALIS